MSSTVWISAVIYHVTHVCMSSCDFGVWASMDNGHIVFQTCENIARLTYANSQLPLLCEFFLIPATLLVFRFNHLLSWVGPYNWNVVYREQDMFLLHLIASYRQLFRWPNSGASKAPERPNGFVFVRRCHGTSWKHHPEAKPLGKNMPSRIWDSSLRMTDGWLICGIVNHRRWRWHLKNRPTNVENNDFCSFVGPSQSKMRMCFLSLIPVFLFSAVGVPPGLGQHVFWNRIYPETQARRSDSVDFFFWSKQGTPFLEIPAGNLT